MQGPDAQGSGVAEEASWDHGGGQRRMCQVNLSVAELWWWW